MSRRTARIQKRSAWLMQTVRDRSIAARAQGVIVPSDLGDASRIKRGAAEYGEMCAMCHLGPGVERSEISQGLYPRAPELAGGTKRSGRGAILDCKAWS